MLSKVVVSTKLRKITLTIQMILLFCFSSILLVQVKSDSALGTYLSKNNFCKFWLPKIAIPACRDQRTFCSQHGLPGAPKGWPVTAVLGYEQLQPPASDLRRSLVVSAEGWLWQHFTRDGFHSRLSEGFAAYGAAFHCTVPQPLPSKL